MVLQVNEIKQENICENCGRKVPLYISEVINKADQGSKP